VIGSRQIRPVVNISSQAGIIALREHAADMASKAPIHGITHVPGSGKGPPLRAMIPAGHSLNRSEIAAAVLYPASDAAANLLRVDGGATIH
jgi:hypothetical protein